LPWTATSDFSCDAAAPAKARRFCAEQLGSVLPDRPDAEDVIADAVLVTSELVTNAVRAGCSRITLELSLAHDALQLAVHDDAPGIPVERAPRPDEPRGRGLAITARIANRWGYRPSHTGKQVWAHLPVTVT
jgi:anti-sigma regulatory factor (Ser/Thr protein kinase)